jgi:hypothetical protein
MYNERRLASIDACGTYGVYPGSYHEENGPQPPSSVIRGVELSLSYRRAPHPRAAPVCGLLALLRPMLQPLSHAEEFASPTSAR